MRVLAAVIGLLALTGAATAQELPSNYANAVRADAAREAGSYVPWSGTSLYSDPTPSYQPIYDPPLISNSNGGFTTYSDGTMSNTTGGFMTFSDGTLCNSYGGTTTCSGSSLGGPVEIYLNAIGR